MNQKPITSAPVAPAASASSSDDELQRAINDITNRAISDSIFDKPSEAPARPFAPPAPSASSSPSTPPLSFPTPQSFQEPPSPLDFITTPIEPAQKTPAAPVPPSIVTPSQPIDEKNTAPKPTMEIPKPERPEKPDQPEKPAKPADTSELSQLKKQTLEELIPILGNLRIDASEKFKIYRGYIENGHEDLNILKSAREAASDIRDESSRAEALFFIYNHLNK